MTPASKKPRVALFVEAHEGFGHFQIVSQLARQLEQQGAEVMVLSGTLDYAAAGNTFDFGHAQKVALPLVDYRTRADGTWEYVSANHLPYEADAAYIDQRKNAVKAALAEFKPDMVVTEYFPVQQPFRMHDLHAVEELYADARVKPAKIALCRDIIYNAHPQQIIDLIDTHYDRLLVRGDGRFTTLADSHPDWGNITVPVEYMGNYVTPLPPRNEALSDAARPVVIFSGGGYHSSDLPYLEGLIRSRAQSSGFQDRDWHMYVSANTKKHRITDPEDPSREISVFEHLTRLAERESHGRIRVSEPVADTSFHQDMADAAVVVCRGGYNITFELLSSQQRALIVPRANFEEITRANALYKNGAAQMYPPYPLATTASSAELNAALADPKDLARAIDAAGVMQTRAVENNLDHTGAATTARRMIELIHEKAPPAWAKGLAGKSAGAWSARTAQETGSALSK